LAYSNLGYCQDKDLKEEKRRRKWLNTCYLASFCLCNFTNLYNNSLTPSLIFQLSSCYKHCSRY
jgi:hypothetical protein